VNPCRSGLPLRSTTICFSHASQQCKSRVTHTSVGDLGWRSSARRSTAFNG
jgi:hypothetical protein